MSNHPVKRPLRLLPGADEAGMRVALASSGDDMVLPAEWFRRILLGERETRPPPPEQRPDKRLAHEFAPSQAEAAPVRAGESSPAAQAIASTAPASAARPVGERPPVAAEESMPRQLPAQAQDQRSWGSPDQSAQDRWSEQMASLVDDLCSRADPAFRSWTATLRMDPNVLPDTQLRLSLSPHWLSLRFMTESAAATHLVSTHRPELQSLLENAPHLPHRIDIDIA